MRFHLSPILFFLIVSTLSSASSDFYDDYNDENGGSQFENLDPRESDDEINSNLDYSSDYTNEELDDYVNERAQPSLPKIPKLKFPNQFIKKPIVRAKNEPKYEPAKKLTTPKPAVIASHIDKTYSTEAPVKVVKVVTPKPMKIKKIKTVNIPVKLVIDKPKEYQTESNKSPMVCSCQFSNEINKKMVKTSEYEAKELLLNCSCKDEKTIAGIKAKPKKPFNKLVNKLKNKSKLIRKPCKKTSKVTKKYVPKKAKPVEYVPTSPYEFKSFFWHL